MIGLCLLVFATCCDSFFMSIAYGIENIKIPWKSVMIIAFCGTFFLGLSMSLAQVINSLISPSIGKWLSFTILFLLGFSNLFQHSLKKWVRKHKQPFTFQVKGVSFVIDIFLDETEADADHSKEISMKEALYLGVALSIDSLASGLAYGIGFTEVTTLLLLSFVMGVLMIVLGCYLGTHFIKGKNQDVSWISGCLLLLLAFLRFH